MSKFYVIEDTGAVVVRSIVSTDLPAVPPPPSPPSPPPVGPGGNATELQMKAASGTGFEGVAAATYDSAGGALIFTQGKGTATPGTFAAMFRSLSQTEQQAFRALLGLDTKAAEFSDTVRSVTICSGANGNPGVAISYVPASPGDWPMGPPPPGDVWIALDVLSARVKALEAAP